MSFPEQSRIYDRDYLREFEERLAKLEFLPKRRPNKFFEFQETLLFGIYPDKLSSIVLFHAENDWGILMSNNSQSGYRLGDHERILGEHRLSFNTSTTFMGLIIIKNEQRYLIINGLNWVLLCESNVEALKQALTKYQITLALSVDKNKSNLFLPLNDPETSLASDDYLTQIDELLFDFWTIQVAQVYGLTVSQWLRFRLIGELPLQSDKTLL